MFRIAIFAGAFSIHMFVSRKWKLVLVNRISTVMLDMCLFFICKSFEISLKQFSSFLRVPLQYCPLLNLPVLKNNNNHSMALCCFVTIIFFEQLTQI